MNATLVLEKLKSLGVPADTIDAIEQKLDSGMLGDIQTLGLKGALDKNGIDTSKLPDIGLDDVKNFGAELMGKDVDGDGKTGLAEVVDTAQDAFAKVKDSGLADKVKDVAEDKLADAKEAGGGLMAKIKGFFGA